MSEPKLIGERNFLFLDEAVKRGVERELPPAYPSLTQAERDVLKVMANALYISESAIQWLYFNAKRGNKDAGRRVLDVLAGRPVKLVVK